MKKKFSTKEEVQTFKKQYTHGIIETEVISNILQPNDKTNNQFLQDYCDFHWPKDDKKYGLMGVLEIMVLRYAPHALKEAFGDPDFSFEGNAIYQNYVLDYHGLTIIASAKREVVLDKTPHFKEKLVQFENDFYQFVVDYMVSHEKELSTVQLQSLKKLKEAGILTQENQINFK